MHLSCTRSCPSTGFAQHVHLDASRMREQYDVLILDAKLRSNVSAAALQLALQQQRQQRSHGQAAGRADADHNGAVSGSSQSEERKRPQFLPDVSHGLPLWHAEGLQLELEGWSGNCLLAPEGEGPTLYAAR